jgi:ABC-2 type transport system ATP-binding protein
MSHTGIQVHGLIKKFRQNIVLNDLNFSVNNGELFGLIGPDGAGKTTLFRIMATLMLADSGSISFFGFDVVRDFKQIRSMIGYMPGRFSLYQDLSVEENLNFFATVFGTTVSENYAFIQDIYSQIEPFKNRLAGKLSGGMKQKLALSCALIHAPKCLILDEPTTGVDAVSRVEFWNMLKNLQKQGITILVSTPYMDEAGLCDRIALFQKGQILSIDTPDRVAGSFDKKLWAVSADDKFTLIESLRNLSGIDSVNTFGDSVHITTTDNRLEKRALIRFLSERMSGEITVSDITPTIEDCFLRLMRKQPI